MPRRHATRLRHYWRTRGWAHHDNIDVDLLAWGWVREITDGQAASRFVLTDAGRTALGAAVARNRSQRRPHERVAQGVAQYLAGLGRLVFTELSVHTDVDQRWQPCKPDVFSLVRGLRADHLSAQVHEIKVTRADLLGELRRCKTARYHELAGQIFLVLREGIAEPEEIPRDYGVAVWDERRGYRLLRPAPCRDYKLQTRHWMALAKATPFRAEDDGEVQLSF